LITITVISVVIGAIVAGVTGIGVLGLVVGVVLFLCGLPGALLVSFVQGEVSYAQDRADYRQWKSDFIAQEIADDHEYLEEDRTERLIDTIKKNPTEVYHDNRQIHFHGNTGSIR
jgi:hypothetical protein